MFTTLKREYNDNQLDEFENVLVGNMLPESLSDIGRLVSSSLKFKSYRIVDENDNNLYTVQIKPCDNLQTVDQNDPVQVDYDAFVYSADNVWYLENEEISNSDLFPELRQAYHEGNSFKDRDADYKYHFDNGDVLIAISAPNPVNRLDEELLFEDIKFLGGMFPRKWLLATTDDEYYFLRERSGTVKLISDAGNGDLVFHAYIGREHPGTTLQDHEVLNLISSVDYINIEENVGNDVPEEVIQMYESDTRSYTTNDFAGEDDDVENPIEEALEEAEKSE